MSQVMCMCWNQAKEDAFITAIKIGTRTYDISEIQQLIPRLEIAVQRKDDDIKRQKEAIEAQQRRIAELEANVELYKTECDKLRCVLTQKSSRDSNDSDGSEWTERVGGQAAVLYEMNVPSSAVKSPPQRPKKLAVSAEPTAAVQKKIVLKHYPKSAGSKQLIRAAVQKNDFLRFLAKEQVIELVECMYEKRVEMGQWIIREGEPGYRLFVVADGQVRISKGGVKLSVLTPPVVIGELAILYNCQRTASVQALTDVTLWVLERDIYKSITMKIGMERHSEMMAFLHKVSLVKSLGEDKISKMADAFDQDYYAAGSYIIRQGERGDAFFIINSGQVRVTRHFDGEPEARQLRVLSKGDYFGEKALLGEEVRTANVIAMDPGVEVLTLDRDSFTRLIGHLDTFNKHYVDSAPPPSHAGRYDSVVLARKGSEQIADEFKDIKLSQLDRIFTLGVGGFGRVDLVCINGDETRTYALKTIRKKHIVDTHQQDHIFAERNIMLATRSNFIVRMHRTFRDTRNVYMLMEVCLGGELWTIMRSHKYFDDESARFYVACVVEAFDYLHRRNTVYRDLKPENCMLDSRGYLKLVDLGFAKKLEKGKKTWTFCGTPEYVAPEIILNRGHDLAVDYWALGIYVCELVLGRPPFQASDPMKTYTLILKGIRGLDIPNKRVSKAAASMVKKLCKDNPSDRLGSGSGGINDIRKHKWFSGFDWDGLRAGSLNPPILPLITSATDCSNFDEYPPEEDEAPEEFSGWDEGF